MKVTWILIGQFWGVKAPLNLESDDFDWPIGTSAIAERQDGQAQNITLGRFERYLELRYSVHRIMRTCFACRRQHDEHLLDSSGHYLCLECHHLSGVTT